ncbi:hypothetical protein BGZ60DRAFT_388156 [Tricladium varicosporioides]|nr:hypothetical protein BGZ60DRAFT_388156 [Hymenoscyphus varicosporioides]
MSSSFSSPEHKYIPVTDVEQNDTDNFALPSKHSVGVNSRLKAALPIFVYGFILAALCGGSFFAGTYYGQQRISITTVLSLPGNVPKPFLYNHLYASPPTNASDEAWDNIFPPKLGALHNITEGNQKGSYAVYHQLHCLQALRVGYYTALSAMNESRQLTAEELKGEFMGSPAHAQHCIDYLRQSLMCHADTNIEPVIEEKGGVIGFGSTHFCRNYEALKEQVAERQRLEPKSSDIN